MADVTREGWSRVIFDQLVDAGATLFTYIPDFGNAAIIDFADEHNETRSVLLTSERKGSRSVDFQPTQGISGF